MCSPSPPPAPDYQAQAQAQGAANVQAAQVSNTLNNPNVVSPYGTQTFSEGTTNNGFNEGAYQAAMQQYQNSLQPVRTTDEDGNVSWSAPGNVAAPNIQDFYNLPTLGRPTVTQTFSPEQQRIFEQSNQLKNLLGGLGIQGAESLQGLVGTKVDFSGAPQVGSYDATRQKVYDAMMSRTNEDYSKQREGSNSDLIAAGIRPGTKAYGDRMQMIERSRNDARSQAELQAGNAAAQAQTLDTQRRKDYIGELLAQRQTPLNEINALVSSSQVSNPFAVPGVAQNAQVAPAPIFGAAQAQDQANTGIYNANVASATSTQNAAIGAAGAGLAAYLAPAAAMF